MTYSIDEINKWEQGDSIEVAGTLCQNPHDAMIVHIGNFYTDSTKPINPGKDAIEMIKVGWVSRENYTEDDLPDFIEKYKILSGHPNI